MAKKFDYDGELVTLYWDYVKWDVGLEELGIEGCEEVMFFENFYRKLKHYKFIRIGEQEDDVELDCAGDYVFCTSVFRTIECGGEEFACNIDNKKPRKVKGEKYEWFYMAYSNYRWLITNDFRL